MLFQNCDCSKLQHKAIGAVLGLLLLAITVWFGVAIINQIKAGEYIGQEIEGKNSITVSGSGEVYAKPDLAIVDFSVVTEKETVAEAMTENSTKMNAIIDAVKKQGVEEKDIKTTTFYISPRYEWYDEIKCLYYPCPSGERVLVGYEITQTLEVKIRDMSKIGTLIQLATEGGANQVGDLYFTIENEDALKAQARKEAIAKAKSQAKELASQLGVKLVKILAFNEGGYYPAPSFYMKEEVQGMGGGEVTPDIETGENKIEISVSITYEIQ